MPVELNKRKQCIQSDIEFRFRRYGLAIFSMKSNVLFFYNAIKRILKKTH